MQSVNELCEKGNSLSEVGMYQEALSCFKHALEKTPETYDYEDERVWILVAIGVREKTSSIRMCFRPLKRKSLRHT